MRHTFELVIATLLAASLACQEFRGSYAFAEPIAVPDAGESAAVLYDIAEYSCPPGQGVESATCDERRRRSLFRLDLATGAATRTADLFGVRRLIGITDSAEVVLVRSGETYGPLPGRLDFRIDRVDWIDLNTGVAAREVSLPVIAPYVTAAAFGQTRVFLYAEQSATIVGESRDRTAFIADRDLASAVDVAVPGRVVFAAWDRATPPRLIVALGDSTSRIVRYTLTGETLSGPETLATLPGLDQIATWSAPVDPRGPLIAANGAASHLAYVTGSAPSTLRIAAIADAGVAWSASGPSRVSFSPSGERAVATTRASGDAGATVTVLKLSDLQATTIATSLVSPFARVVGANNLSDDALVVVVDSDGYREKVLFGTEVGRDSQVFSLAGALVGTVAASTLHDVLERTINGERRLVFVKGSDLKSLSVASGAEATLYANWGQGSVWAAGAADILVSRIERTAGIRRAFQQYAVFSRLSAVDAGAVDAGSTDAGRAFDVAWRTEFSRGAP
ncbi:MAG: hypothetical protein HYY84_15900 [Deltaproteobacteria bacterium]|nr:hypothetical protein [Deltaproteobacteria bacterium]